MPYHLNFGFVWQHFDRLAWGLLLSLEMAVLSIAIGVLIGLSLALKGFAAAMLGGMGNPKGAFVGGLLLGVLEALTAGYISSQYKDAAAFVVILAVLFAMPQGLFGAKSTDRV